MLVYHTIAECQDIAEGNAREAGVEVMKLSVRQGDPAQRAYERAGFVPETMGMIK